MSHTDRAEQAPARKRSPLRRLVKIVVGIACVFVLAVAGLVAIPIVSPSAGAQLADTLRAIVGPQPVADLESVSFQIQDLYNRTRYQLSGDQPQLSFASTPVGTEPTLAPVPTRAARATAASLQQPEGAQNSSQPAGATTPMPQPTRTAPMPTITPVPNVVDASPYISGGWQPFGPIVGGNPVVARGTVHPDRTRPYAQAAVVRIDLSQVDLHFMLGTMEPVAAKGTHPISRPGAIPTTDQLPDRLLAAFNGGFKSIHGNYGVIANGTTIITPMYGMASLAIYNDGSIDLGAWGRDINPSDNLVDLRQNCPLLLDAGYINPTVNDGSRKEWGYTVKNLDTTWRSGIGITKDGRFLIYAAGNSLTVQSLAQALQTAGAYHAMQLDINGYYTRFAIYEPTVDAKSRHLVTASKLLNEMTISPSQFLEPYDRDFFYITLHSG